MRKRLIDANDLITAFEFSRNKSMGGAYTFDTTTLDKIKQIINKAHVFTPDEIQAEFYLTLELDKRPKGQWEDDRCSVCHCDPLRDFTEPAGLDGGSWISTPMNYCPNCGADMRKEAENEIRS